MSSIYDHKPVDFAAIRTRPLDERAAKVSVNEFARPYQPGEGLRGWLQSLPRVLAANGMAELIAAMLAAQENGKAIVWGIGGHVIKCGLAPTLLSLMQRGFVSAIAMNGAAAVHDTEIALCGSTSEQVEDVLTDGSFGAADETGRVLQAAVKGSMCDGIGLGESLGRQLRNCAESGAEPHAVDLCASLLAGAYAARVPVTVHVAIGTDTPHLHPCLDPGALGAASHRDFRLFCEMVRLLEGGGVYLNVGSAVVLPEVFLKAVSAVRNLGHPVSRFYTANLDFLQHYRPNQNVVKRPTALGGKGWAITGHHEIMVPLLAAVLIEYSEERAKAAGR